MQYRIKEVERYGSSYYYPQYKNFLFWRRLVWYGGEDGYTPMTCFYTSKEDALERIEQDKEKSGSSRSHCSASPDAVQYADYILNHYSRDSHTDKICLARDLERHGWKKSSFANLPGCKPNTTKEYTQNDYVV